MDERESHFFTLVAEVCESARLAELPVRLRLEDGSHFERRDVTVTPGVAPLDDTGYPDGLDLGDTWVRLSEVVEIAVARGTP